MAVTMKPKSKLLSLPREIRDEILKFALSSKRPLDRMYWKGSRCLRSILEVNKQLRAEGEPILYKVNSFKVHRQLFSFIGRGTSLSRALEMHDTVVYMESPRASLRSKIKHLVVDFSDTEHFEQCFRYLETLNFASLESLTIELDCCNVSYDLDFKGKSVATAFRLAHTLAKIVVIKGEDEGSAQRLEERLNNLEQQMDYDGTIKDAERAE